MKNLIFFIIIFLIAPIYLSSSWQVNLSGKERSYTSIKCVDELNCVATCYSQLDEFNYQDSAYILRTTNGGNTWFNIYYKLDLKGRDTFWTFECTDIEYPSDSVIIASTNYGVVIKSIDRGSSWKYSVIDKKLTMENIFMPDEKNGWLHGYKFSWVNNKPKYDYFLYKTIDAWDTWELVDFQKIGNSKGVLTMATPSKSLVLISGFKDGSCYLYRSTDFGENWSQAPWTLDIENIWFLNDSIGYCAGGFPIKGGSGYSDCREIIYKTIDGGVNWFLLRDTINNQHAGLRFIRFYDEKHGIACGYDRILIKTNDSGKTWHYENVGKQGTYTTVMNVAYPSRDRAFAILALEDLWRNEEMTGIEDFDRDYTNFFISPNPATDYIEISYSPSVKRGVGGVSEDPQIKIYNVFGQLVLNNSQFSAEAKLRPAKLILNSQLRVDLSTLVPGLYFVRIGEKVGKFVKY